MTPNSPSKNDGGSANSRTLTVSTPATMAPKRDKRALGSPEPPTSPLRAPVPPPPLTTTPEEVKVNAYNGSELKVALDDALKRYAANDETGFRTVNRHTDVKLVLGWSAVLVATLTAGYGWMVEFEKSKPAVWTGVVLSVFVHSLIHLAHSITGTDTFSSLAHRRYTSTSSSLKPSSSVNARHTQKE